jgi:signal transduction histidine kinase
VRVFSIPVLEQGRVIGAIQMPYPLTEVYRAVDGLRQTLLLLSPFALLIAGIGGYMMTGRALQAVQGITFAARRIGADALHQRLPVQGEDELGQLAGTFNAMLSRIEEGFNTKQNLIVQLNRLIEQQRRFTADAAHELRTPLTAIKINAEITLSHEATAAEYRLALQEINSTSTTLARLVDDLLLLARSDSGQLVRNLIDLPLQEPIQIAMAHVRRPDRAPITLQMGEEPIVVQACQDELTRLFTNLLENAARHTPADGKIVVTLKRAGGMAMVTVQDTGTGVAPEHLAHLGERFYRIDSARNREAGGSGLGLSICKSIVEAHRGTLTFASKLGEGTRVTVSLPLL